jgi:hypothetical protein
MLAAIHLAPVMDLAFADLFATLLTRVILVFEGLLLCDIGGSFWW